MLDMAKDAKFIDKGTIGLREIASASKMYLLRMAHNVQLVDLGEKEDVESQATQTDE